MCGRSSICCTSRCILLHHTSRWRPRLLSGGPKRRANGQYWSAEHILPHPSASSYVEVPALQDEWQGIPAFISDWLHPVRVHEFAPTCHAIILPSGYKTKCLPRWLANVSQVYHTSQTACPDGLPGASTSWLDHQLQKVRIGPCTIIWLYRHAVWHSHLHRCTPTKHVTQEWFNLGVLEEQPQRIGQGSPLVAMETECASEAECASTPSVVGVRGPVPEDKEMVKSCDYCTANTP